MAYPESAAVSAGDATLASHFNYLRKDAVYFGKDSADAVALGTLLERFETRLEVERLDTTKIRVPASATAPVSIIIDGYSCQAVANVDLDAGEVPAGGASVYYIFANRTDSSTTFTLTVSSSSTEAANQRRIGRFYWDGSAIVKDSVRSELAGLIADLLYFNDPQVCNGRLTLSTGVAVSSADVSSSASLYFTPYLGNRVSLYVNDYGWRVYTFSELTLDISGLSDATNYDIFLYDNVGTLTLSATAWSNDTLRATSLVKQDGVYCKTGALGYRYLGTIRMSGAGVSADTEDQRYCWNYYNQVHRKLSKKDTTASWTYNAVAIRAMNNDSSNKVEFVIGLDEEPVHLIHHMGVKAGTASAYMAYGIGLDSITVYVAEMMGRSWCMSAVTHYVNGSASYDGYPGIGYHYLSLLEASRASYTTTYYGNTGSADGVYTMTGCTGWVMG